MQPSKQVLSVMIVLAVSASCLGFLLGQGTTQPITLASEQAGGSPSPAADQARRVRDDEPTAETKLLDTATIMKLKLQATQGLLSGIATEDFQQVAQAGQQLLQLSSQSNWQVLQTLEYNKRSAAFRKQVAAVIQDAKAKDVERLLASYAKLTRNCVECHQYLRSADR